MNGAAGGGDVFAAAVAWWEGHRPLAWDAAEHLRHPTVNCIAAREQRLARAIADALRTSPGSAVVPDLFTAPGATTGDTK